MLEKPLHQYRSYDGQSDLNISEEIALAEAKLKELVCMNASEDTISRTMKKIGTQRFCIWTLFVTCTIYSYIFTLKHDTSLGMMFPNFYVMAKQSSEVWMDEYLCFHKGNGWDASIWTQIAATDCHNPPNIHYKHMEGAFSWMDRRNQVSFISILNHFLHFITSIAYIQLSSATHFEIWCEIGAEQLTRGLQIMVRGFWRFFLQMSLLL